MLVTDKKRMANGKLISGFTCGKGGAMIRHSHSVVEGATSSSSGNSLHTSHRREVHLSNHT